MKLTDDRLVHVYCSYKYECANSMWYHWSSLIAYKFKSTFLCYDLIIYLYSNKRSPEYITEILYAL